MLIAQDTVKFQAFGQEPALARVTGLCLQRSPSHSRDSEARTQIPEAGVQRQAGKHEGLLADGTGGRSVPSATCWELSGKSQNHSEPRVLRLPFGRGTAASRGCREDYRHGLGCLRAQRLCQGAPVPSGVGVHYAHLSLRILIKTCFLHDSVIG